MSTDYTLDTIQVSLSAQDRFAEYLQSRGMRNTGQRRRLVEHVFSTHEHFDADHLIEQFRAFKVKVVRSAREDCKASVRKPFKQSHGSLGRRTTISVPAYHQGGSRNFTEAIICTPAPDGFERVRCTCHGGALPCL